MADTVFIHPGVLHSGEELNRLKKLVTNWELSVPDKENPEYWAYQSYLLLKKDSRSQASYVMRGPFPVIARDGEYRDTKPKFEADFHASYQNALMWALTGCDVHAKKSLQILSAYANMLKEIPDTNDAPLLAGLQGTEIICALELLKYTYPNLDDRQMEAIERMFRAIFIPVLDTFYDRPPYTNGNWGLIFCKVIMAAGIYFDDHTLYEKGKLFYLNAHDNGTIENYIDGETGQLQESGRDQGHSMLGLGNMAVLCEIAWKQGYDLWSALDNRLLKAYEYLAKYNLGHDDVPFTQWKDITGKYSDWPVISNISRGKFKPVFEIAYNHYVRRRNFSMPYTARVLDKIRPEGFDGDHPPGFGSLFYTTKDE
ncbi:MAG: alginate lyase family protein [Treponema sp.]|jgi:hypothetical protein|nr:alginate lyase family protein [Treponema sp.]